MFGFCKCGGLLMPTPNGFSKCRKCGAEQRSNKESLVKTATHETKKVAVLEHDEPNLPTVERECEKCENGTCYFWFIQTRSSDEPPTRFFRCTKCGHTWREYS